MPAGETGSNVEQPEFLNDKDAAEDRQVGKEKESHTGSATEKGKERIVEESVKNTFRH